MLWHCWLGDRKGIRPIKKLDVGLLVVMIWLELCMTYNSSSPVVTTTSIIFCVNKHQQTPVHLENGRENWERIMPCYIANSSKQSHCKDSFAICDSLSQGPRLTVVHKVSLYQPETGMSSLWLPCSGPVLSRFYLCSWLFQWLHNTSIHLCYRLHCLILHRQDIESYHHTSAHYFLVWY